MEHFDKFIHWCCSEQVDNCSEPRCLYRLLPCLMVMLRIMISCAKFSRLPRPQNLWLPPTSIRIGATVKPPSFEKNHRKPASIAMKQGSPWLHRPWESVTKDWCFREVNGPRPMVLSRHLTRTFLDLLDDEVRGRLAHFPGWVGG